MKVLIFDTETTGLPKRWNSKNPKWYLDYPNIIQISWLLYDMNNNKILDESDYIVKLDENIKIDEQSIKIHNISREKSIKEGQNIKEILTKFNFLLKSCDLLVAHNLDFDKKMIIAENLRNNISNPFLFVNNKEYCTMKETKDLCKIRFNNIYTKNYLNERENYKYPKLEELHQILFNVKPIHLHNSLNDVYICFRCFYKLYKNTDILYINKQICNKISKLL